MLFACICKAFLAIRGCFAKPFCGSKLTFLPLGLVLKIGETGASTEADTLRYIRNHTTIPVPRLLMEKEPGTDLHCVWAKLSADSRARILAQLRDYIAASPPPTGPIGPFVNEAAFNDRLIETGRLFVGEDDLLEIGRRMRGNRRIVFTHGDLAPRNIRVDGDQIVAIIDWEESGWYPEH
ncbi:kinase-like domain-containing protein [Trametes polyzona]|nr:kinase-like domain-containing protein [Trametes polyzona]